MPFFSQTRPIPELKKALINYWKNINRYWEECVQNIALLKHGMS